MDVLEFIPYGRENAIKRANLRDLLGVTDIEMRRMIGEARKETPIINLQDSQGYYRPNDKEDLHRYIMQEQSRAMSILKNIKVACEEYNKISGQITLECDYLFSETVDGGFQE